jgi:hypothetical protein
MDYLATLHKVNTGGTGYGETRQGTTAQVVKGWTMGRALHMCHARSGSGCWWQWALRQQQQQQQS